MVKRRRPLRGGARLARGCRDAGKFRIRERQTPRTRREGPAGWRILGRIMIGELRQRIGGRTDRRQLRRASSKLGRSLAQLMSIRAGRAAGGLRRRTLRLGARRARGPHAGHRGALTHRPAVPPARRSTETRTAGTDIRHDPALRGERAVRRERLVKKHHLTTTMKQTFRDYFVEHFFGEDPAEFERFSQALLARRPKTFRVNRLKTDMEGFVKRWQAR